MDLASTRAMEIIKPAHLAFLAIYNPDLGPTDESVSDQLVYYYAGKTEASKNATSKLSEEDQARSEQNEQLRHIGLAQGMVHFGKAFSDGDNVDFVDSEKSRVFIHELEPSWWLLASVNLTQLHTTVTVKDPKTKTSTKQTRTEYSGREVSPAGLLLRQVLDAHSVFLLHHGISLAEIYSRIKRPKFCAALDRFWNRFLRDWDVLIHGNPAVEIYPGIKLAAGGELGIGVGEEGWGSGEREVLEDFTRRTDGLVDVVVSHFGTAQGPSKDESDHVWPGGNHQIGSADGVIYSGTGHLTRNSVDSVSKWMEWVYKHGFQTYGVQDNPHTPKRRRRPKQDASQQNQSLDQWPTGVPPPLISSVSKSLDDTIAKVDQKHTKSAPAEPGAAKGSTDVLMKYMTFGIYGSGWGLSTGKTAEQDKAAAQPSKPSPEGSSKSKQTSALSHGAKDTEARNPKPYFLVGLQGSLDDDSETLSGEESGAESDAGHDSRAWNQRILVRTLYVERKRSRTVASDRSDEADGVEELFYTDRLQVVVYVNKPFIFTFLFNLNTSQLGYASFYRSIHHQLGPLQKPLLRSTSPETIQNRLFDAVSPRTVSSVDSKQPIYNLIYDSTNQTVHATVPQIPDANDDTAEWTRLDALNVHLQIVNTRTITRLRPADLERTAKTSRGWWVVWMHIPAGAHNHSKEAILVRKASDFTDIKGRKASYGFGTDISNWGSSAGKVAEGIGIDARRYVEGLISLGR